MSALTSNIMRTSALALVMVMVALLLVFPSRRSDARPERIKAGMSYYSDDFVQNGLVSDLAGEKNYEEVYQFYSYYEAIYDDQGRVVTFKEYKRGDVIRTEEYRYRASGGLLERRIVRPGKPIEVTPAAATKATSPK